MDWGDKENRIAVIALHKVGMQPSDIFKTLHTLGISRMFVYRAIERFNDTSGVSDRERSGRPRTTRTPQAVKAVRERIRRNPLRKQKILSREMKIPQRTISRIIKSDLGLGAYRRSTGHLLTDSLKKIEWKNQNDYFAGTQTKNTVKFCLRTKKFLLSKKHLINKTIGFMLAVPEKLLKLPKRFKEVIIQPQ